LAGADPAGLVFDLLAPHAPLQATSPASPTSDLVTISCEPNLELTDRFPLVMCVEREFTSAGDVGESNLMPFTNLTVFQNAGLGYRNQYLYPSTAVVKVAQKAVTIETIHARAVGFSPMATIDYQQGSYVRVYRTDGTWNMPQFDQNIPAASPLHLDWQGDAAGLLRVGMLTGSQVWPTGGTSLLSDFANRGTDPNSNNELSTIFDFLTMLDPAQTNILVDTLLHIPNNADSQPQWDITQDSQGTGCDEPRRAFGGTLGINGAPTTDVLAYDEQAFVWVFRGKALPPPATIQQQVAEIIRLLVTPEGLRCTGLDLDAANPELQDAPLLFPAGQDFDPISPQVTSGKTVTGDEAGDGARRRKGWLD
jgi:hypothetical protein